jgi:hypothetical protein
MTQTIKDIYRSKIAVLHFLIVFLLAFIICGSTFMLIIPLVYFLTLGGGALASEIESLPIHVFIGNWGALTIVLAACGIGAFRQIHKRRFNHAKSYLLTTVFLVILYFFRFQIAYFLIRVFQ